MIGKSDFGKDTARSRFDHGSGYIRASRAAQASLALVRAGARTDASTTECVAAACARGLQRMAVTEDEVTMVRFAAMHEEHQAVFHRNHCLWLSFPVPSASLH